MFVLRRVSPRGEQYNSILGKGYTVVYKETNQEAFDNYCKLNPDKVTNLEKKETYAVIVYETDGMPLYKTDKNYVMTSDGKTFENISFR